MAELEDVIELLLEVVELEEEDGDDVVLLLEDEGEEALLVMDEEELLSESDEELSSSSLSGFVTMRKVETTISSSSSRRSISPVSSTVPAPYVTRAVSSSIHSMSRTVNVLPAGAVRGERDAMLERIYVSDRPSKSSPGMHAASTKMTANRMPAEVAEGDMESVG